MPNILKKAKRKMEITKDTTDLDMVSFVSVAEREFDIYGREAFFYSHDPDLIGERIYNVAVAAPVSVIIPCYNYAQYLDEAIESVLNQSVQPLEIIVVSDGAIDNSVEIAKKYNVTILEKENGGLASARNAGIEIAKGKYIMSFDSDDIMKPDCIKEHMKLADEKSIVTLGLMAFGSHSYTARPRKATVDILLKTNVIYSNTLFPRKAWEEVGGFDESEIMRFGWEDREFWLRVLKAGYESKVGDYIALLWRRHPNNMSSTTADPNHKILQDYIYNKNA